MARTVRVFISWTWQGLLEEREAVERALQRLHDTGAVAMEHVGSRPEAPQEVRLAELDSSDVYVGIFGRRDGARHTEVEYRRAVEHEIPAFVYFKRVGGLIPPDFDEPADQGERPLAALMHEMEGHATISTFSDPDDLAALVVADLGRIALSSPEKSKNHVRTEYRHRPVSEEAPNRLIDVEHELDAVTTRLSSELRAKRPDLFDGSGRPKKGALEKAVQDHTGKKKLTRADILALLRKKSS